MITLGSYETIVPSDKLTAWILENITPSSAFEFPRLKSPSFVALSPFVNIGIGMNVPVRVNVLYMPWGASRWGHSFVLADDDTLSYIRADAYANNVYQPLELMFDDDDGMSIATDMWMLPPVPLSKFDSNDPQIQAVTNELWMIPLVDDRYWWWERSANILVSEGVTTWTDLYEDIGLALEATITVDEIPSVYLKPGRAFIRHYEYLPLLLDWVAASVGQRIVRNLDGTFRAMGAQSMLENQRAIVAAGYDKNAGGGLLLGEADDA